MGRTKNVREETHMSETCAIRRPFQRFLSILMAMIMALSVTILPVAAAYSKQKDVISASKLTEFQITSGKGLFYSLGWKKTTVTVKNTGRYSVAMYEQNKAGLLFYKGQVGPGRTVTMTMRGSGTTSRLSFQRVGGRTTVSVSVNAGSVS